PQTGHKKIAIVKIIGYPGKESYEFIGILITSHSGPAFFEPFPGADVVICKSVRRKVTVVCPETFIHFVLIVIPHQGSYFMFTERLVVIEGKLTIIVDVVISSPGSKTSLRIFYCRNVVLSLVKTSYFRVPPAGI